MMMSAPLKLKPDVLTLDIDLTSIDTTQTLNINSKILGQPRAQTALEFGVNMAYPGNNIFVMGEPGLGRSALVMQYLSDLARNKKCPASYAYVDNFDNAREPKTLRLPAGFGHQFYQDIDKLIDNILITFPAVFESPNYQQKKRSSNGNSRKLIIKPLSR
jgi:hypothetical protein